MFYLNTVFGVFIGSIFGLVFSVYFWVVLRNRSVVRAVAFVLSSTAAYVLAFFSTLLLGASHLNDRGGGAIADSPAWVFFIGGVIGAVVVLIAALLLHSNEHDVAKIVLLAAGWSLIGGILGVAGWGLGPSLGRGITSVVDPKSLALRPYAPEDALYEFSLYFVWQAGMGGVLGVLFSRSGVREDLAPHAAPAKNSGPIILSLRVGFICAVVATLAFFGRRLLPEQYRQARLERALALHHSAMPPRDNLPKLVAQPPGQMLILNPIGEYLPGPPDAGASQPEIDPHSQLPVPTAQRYDVTYTLHGWVPGAGGGRIEAHVEEFPNGRWAEYMLKEYPLGVSADTVKSIKFGNRIYASPQFVQSSGNTYYLYVWSSGNRLVCIQFWVAPDVSPDRFLKAYLAKYPSSL
ncbi:MAG: hypothetical protein WAN12_14720 [Candidatus Acidiferrum sp.]